MGVILSTANNTIKLVPKRKCGGCNVCCHSLQIETTGLVKRPNERCHNLSKGGKCGLYPDWPKLCQEYFCAWRALPDLDDEWRPDKINVLLEFSQESFPPPFAGKTGFRITILDKSRVRSNYKLASFVAKQVQIGVPCILSYGNNRGENPATVFLNTALQRAVMSGPKKEIGKEILKAVNVCEQMPKQKTKIENGKIIDV